MTAQNDLDRALGAFFYEDAISVPSEPLARVIVSTRNIRPRPALAARLGSQWTGAGSTIGRWGGRASLRPAMVAALVALLVVALVGAAVLVAGSLMAPKTPPRTYTNVFTAAPDLSMPMAQGALVALADGRVLVIGGDGDAGSPTTRALVYDPATGVSEPAGPLASSEWLWVESAVRLKDEKVLIIGNGFGQLFVPATLQFAPVGPMVTPRTGASVAALSDGRVLVTGGMGLNGDLALSSAELFDPETLTFSATGSMGSSRAFDSAAALPDGRVFVAPGEGRTSADVYDPSTGTFSVAGTMSTLLRNMAIALPDGRAVVLGSTGIPRQGFAQVWDPTSLTFSPERRLPGSVTGAALLDDGRVLLVGGENAKWSGIYDLTTGEILYSKPPKAWWPSVTRLTDGRVLLVGGLIDGNVHPGPDGGGISSPAVSTVEIFQ
jgi:hypothetical protein